MDLILNHTNHQSHRLSYEANMCMVIMKVFTKQEYVDLIPRVTIGDYERLKKSIREQGLLNPMLINQDNVVLDGHHRLRV
jgi:disulfide oxidoreductase YuzD